MSGLEERGRSREPVVASRGVTGSRPTSLGGRQPGSTYLQIIIITICVNLAGVLLLPRRTLTTVVTTDEYIEAVHRSVPTSTQRADIRSFLCQSSDWIKINLSGFHWVNRTDYFFPL